MSAEVLSFNYKHPSTDLLNEQAATDETKFLLHSYYNSSPELKVFDKALDVKAVSGNTMVQDASGTLKVFINDPDNTISSTIVYPPLLYIRRWKYVVYSKLKVFFFISLANIMSSRRTCGYP